MKKTLALTVGCLSILAITPAAAAPAEQAATKAASFTDTDIQAYVAATAEVMKLWSDASLSDGDKQEQMKLAVQNTGLAVAKFNAITRAARTDQQLKTKLRQAAQLASFG